MKYTRATALFEMIENRKLERFDLELGATVEIIAEDVGPDAHVLDLKTRDICAGGAFFCGDTCLPEKTRVKVVLVMPIQKLQKVTGQNVHISVRGQVIRSALDGFAVRFDPEYQIESH